MDPGGAGDGENCAGPPKIVLKATGKYTRGRLHGDRIALAFAPADHGGGVHQARNAIARTRMFQPLATDVYGPNIGFGLTPRSSPRSHYTSVQRRVEDPGRQQPRSPGYPRFDETTAASAGR